MMPWHSSGPLDPARALRVGVLVWLLAGCSREPASLLDLRISDGDWGDYQRSLARIEERQTREERAEFNRALQELKLQAMVTHNLSAGPAANAHLRRELAGLTVRDVLVLGHTIKLERKKDEEKALLRSILMNARLRPRPGDEASEDHLAGVRSQQAKQLKELRSDIAALGKQINAWSPDQAKFVTDVISPQDLDEKPQLERNPKRPAPSI